MYETTIVEGVSKIDSYLMVLSPVLQIGLILGLALFVICNDFWWWNWWKTTLVEFGLALMILLICWILWLIN